MTFTGASDPCFTSQEGLELEKWLVWRLDPTGGWHKSILYYDDVVYKLCKQAYNELVLWLDQQFIVRRI